jgi:hypothetical protein
MKKYAYEEDWDDNDCFTDGGDAVVEKDALPEGDAKAVETPPEETPPEEKTVPLASLESERQRRQHAEGNVVALTEHLKTLQLESQPKQELSGGAGDDDVITGRELKVIIGGLEKKFGNEIARIGSVNSISTALLQVRSEHPDYDEVINTNLVNVLNANPKMKAALSSASEEFRPLLAYTIATMDEAYIKKSNDSTVTEIKDRLKANNEKPGSVNQVGGTADDTDMAKIIANESSEDFQKRVNAVKAKAGA